MNQLRDLKSRIWKIRNLKSSKWKGRGLSGVGVAVGVGVNRGCDFGWRDVGRVAVARVGGCWWEVEHWDGIWTLNGVSFTAKWHSFEWIMKKKKIRVLFGSWKIAWFIGSIIGSKSNTRTINVLLFIEVSIKIIIEIDFILFYF